jgi:beta-barrel assembly-enhancing protease
MRRHVWRAGTVVVMAVGFFATGCATNPATQKKELSLISRDQEIALGNQAAPDFEKQFGGKVPNEALQQYVRGVGAKVAAVSDRPMPYEYALLASDVPNAFALPGGKVYVTAGLMKMMTNERQLASVLGHETGHIAAKHSVAGIQRQMGAQVLVEIAGYAMGSQGADAGQVAQLATNMVNLKYSRDDEYEADQLGIRYMSRAGYNPWGMVELLTALNGLDQSNPGWLAEMSQTHPLTPKRIQEAQATVQSEHATANRAEADANAARFLQMKALLK